MKALKLIVLSLLLFAGEKLMAQNGLTVTNNTLINFNITWNFAPCAPIVMPSPPLSTMPGVYCPGAMPVDVRIAFVDNSCMPPAPVNVPIPTAGLPITIPYTLCNGTIVTFNITRVFVLAPPPGGWNYTLTIN
jgi:hypothetical protein